MSDHICFCPLVGLLDVIGKKWALLIIGILGNEGEKGFNDLKSDLKNISPKTLSITLKKIEKLKLINKQILNTSPPTVKYSLTDEGLELRKELIPLLKWISKQGVKDAPWCPINF